MAKTTTSKVKRQMSKRGKEHPTDRSIAVLSSTVAVSHTWPFKFKLVKF